MPSSDNLYGPMFHGAAAARIFSSAAQLAHMINFEIELAYALEEAGVAPAGTGNAIAAACPLPPHGEPIPWLDARAIAEEAVPSGNLAIPFIKYLSMHVEQRHSGAAGFLHFGATSQDVLDTALVLQLRDAASQCDAQLMRLTETLEVLTRTHRDTLLAGRTWLQQGPPVTFGLKCAGWLAATLRNRERLAFACEHALVLQFGGAVGTLASLGDHGEAVSANLARRLKLANPPAPWHARRDNLVEFASTLAILTGTLGKIARDISLLMQTEVAEVFEPPAPGKSGSSTMPHKRNPVACAYILSAAARTPGLLCTLLAAMPQEHERGLGGWHAEWETIPELTLLALGSMEHSVLLLEGLEVSSSRMTANLETTSGYAIGENVVATLTPFLGRLPAHHLVEALTRSGMAENKPLRVVLLSNPEVRARLNEEEIDAALSARNYLGMTSKFIDRILDSIPRKADHAIR